MEKNKNRGDKSNTPMNKQWQGTDKDPAEEKKKSENVTKEDLKSKIEEFLG